ncbi:SusC/RagA family TonB-linked outer membrane protein [Sediminibacterium soli]|uniref:SusC/RagA family TonB-linked outer membrane protein n=1 Tax=Sediminibacterium soli TaxID=2698829 RepID=UPI00137A42AA|nr:TonB-dependent receptor [Sediminibacterium soli]NCI45233.1 TonB-dependent receptor [Sediminibacterium soli]
MINKIRFLFFFLVSMWYLPQLHAQTGRSVTGTIQDEKGEPIRGANIIAKNTRTNAGSGTQTDTLGNFSFVKLPAGGPYTFTVTSLGFQTQVLTGYELKDGHTVTISLKLKTAANNLGDVVVVGYGTQKKLNLTGAVAQAGGEVLENRSISNIAQGLQGVIPNLNLTMGDGKPIQSPTFNIRGTTSIGQGGNALVLIDGVQGDPALLNPMDVASVSVLKDAASASIYGARAAYGVVLITTKNPARDRLNITYSSNYSLKTPTTVPDIVSNGYQYTLMFDSGWRAWNDYSQVPQNINKTQPYSAAYLAEYKKRDADPSLPKVEVGSNGNYVYYGNTDWYDLLYKKHTGAIDQNLAVSGSNGKTSFYITGRYYGQDGIFRYNTDDYKMYNLTAKGSAQVYPWLTITNTTQYNNRSYHNPLNVGEGGGIWRNLADEGHPSSMLFNPDGSLTFSAAYTVGDFVYGKNGIDLNDQVLRNTSGFTAKILGNELRLKGDFTFQNTTVSNKQVRVQVPYSIAPGVVNYVGTSYNDLTMISNKTNYLAANLYAEYEKTLNRDHYFKVLAGYNYEQSVYNGFSATRNGLIYANATDINLALGQSITTNGGYEKWAILGGFARINYSFKDRYLVELNGRYDGSSKFPSNQRYAFFPSASAGWRVSKEAFWNISPRAISDLKIRASYGSLGNGNISSYAYQEQFGITQSGRVIGGVLPQYASAPGVLPSGLTWETAISKDLGLDASFFNNKLTFTGDIYERRTKNMFTVGMTLPAVFGASVPKGNYADLKTTGWELSINWKDQLKLGSKPLHYSIGFNLADYTAVIEKYNNATNTLTDYYPGMKLGEIWGYTNDGYWTKDNVSQAKAMQPLFRASNSGTWLPGDIKFKDMNGDGVINNGDNTLANPGDRRVIGNSLPRYTYGITLAADYSNFFFSAFFQGVGKQDWWPGSESDVFWGQYNRPYNYLMQYQVNRIWSESNPDAYFPRYRGYVAQNGSGELFNAQTRYLQQVRYIRLKNIQLGYNLPAGLLAKVKITGARIYVSGENLWSASPLYKLTKDLDVESIGKSDVVLTGSSNSGNGNNYPIMKSFTVGLSVTF